jgi:redox-sensitive bicupin YhaK (pirin superfamily)
MMMPRYRGILSSQIPELRGKNGVKTKVVCGKIGGVQGPVQGIQIDPEFLDVEVPADAVFSHKLPAGYAVFAYVFAGQGYFDPRKKALVGSENLVTFGDGDGVEITGGEKGVRFLLVSGKPLREPVAWRGPIVMNTEEELRLAFAEYAEGTFLKHRIK